MAHFKGIDKKFSKSREVVVEVWPETLPAIKLFIKCLTQWRAGPWGIIGLDYLAVNLVMDLEGIEPTDRGALLTDIACLEHGYLQAKRR